jgi:ribosome-binding protein aMBF1 (putative translation factor)
MNHREFIAQEEARDPAFKAAMEELQPAHEFHRAVIAARLAAGLTNAQLAERLGKKPAAVARLEMSWAPPRLDALMEIARALDTRFTITPDGRIEVHPPKRRRRNGMGRRAPAVTEPAQAGR